MGKILAVVGLLLALLLLVGAPLQAGGNGDALFASMKCGLCHKPDRKGAGPSFKEISAAYAGKEGQLAAYFKGAAEPIVKPEKAETMQPYIERTKALSDEDLNALSDHLLKAQPQ
ncbi:MAG: c-type cytochrome [Syntrophobacteraceae bacterium]